MKWTKLFIYSGGMILLVAAMERFVIIVSSLPVLMLPDPMLGFPLRYAALIVGGIELVVALICLFGKNTGLQIGWLTWLAANFIVFRIGLSWMHCHPQATCIGSLTDPLHLSRGIAGVIWALLPIYLALGSYTALIRLWLVAPKHSENGYGAVADFAKNVLSRLRRPYQICNTKSWPANSLSALSVGDYLARIRQPENVLRFMWRPYRIPFPCHRAKNPVPALRQNHHPVESGLKHPRPGFADS